MIFRKASEKPRNTVFTTGVIYLLRLMAQPPHHGEQGPDSHVPARAADAFGRLAASALHLRLFPFDVDWDCGGDPRH